MEEVPASSVQDWPSGVPLIGAGLGIGPIGSAAASGIARQPEATAQIQTAAIIFAALVEGTALFGLGLVFLLFAGN